jgi:hypothetical protein
MGLQQDADKTPNQDNRGAERSNGSPSVCVVGTLTETKDLSHLATYRNSEALNVARDLDAKVEDLLRQAAG